MGKLRQHLRRSVCGLMAFGLSAVSAAAGWQALTPQAGQQIDLQSRSNGVSYRIMVSRPDTPAPAEGYPVLYVLDGNAAFPVAAFIARGIARRSSETGLVPPLVVAVAYPQQDDFNYDGRALDYTPSPPGKPLAAAYGGAERFFQFLQTELKPLIRSRFPVDPRRQGIFGHSFGGLFVSYICLKYPQAFSTCLASSPSLWWENQMVLDQLPTAVPADGQPAFQLTVGALEDELPPGKLSAERRAALLSRPMIAPARKLAQALKALSGQAGRVRFQVLEGENHGFAWLPALARGMEYFVQQP
ncbi:alpha/beta hydrolase [Aquitalea aquatilis]|uniref:alpha/beta hydrolase n=1 Tax=Aquitalea aquatilis TaxID=1537400 RepID=UPI0010BD7753|nr:alpha/beta hydrolase-fold protein [Aquitalea aquatilis]